ncbi:MAG: MBL fold metallo-hydrolase [Clostridiales bacterium]|jgi:competence protein ComEC|nr:MBL fold metallo-hydrolase [Clostridiales bacterium]
MKKFKRVVYIAAALSVMTVLTAVLGACKWLWPSPPPPPDGTDKKPESVIDDGDFSVHFLEQGNKYSGDSVYVKSGDIDILIDAGSRNSSAPTLTSYIDKYITDGILEYVIATHGHEDHISGFYSGTSGGKKIAGIFETYEVKTIIDFPLTDKTAPTPNSVVGRYIAARDDEVARGARHYTALECFNNQNGASRKYDIGGGAELEILYNYYYDHTQSGGENDYSVCLMINRGGEHYLFTGDLEKKGEEALVDYYDKNGGGLPHCTLFKAGHHGSSTSSGQKLLAAITPEYVCVCACAGTSEYTDNAAAQFPTQEVIDRIAKYTDKIYVTTVVDVYVVRSLWAGSGTVKPMNGNIVFSVSAGISVINCSNNNKLLRETEWFKENRVMPEAWAGLAGGGR